MNQQKHQDRKMIKRILSGWFSVQLPQLDVSAATPPASWQNKNLQLLKRYDLDPNDKPAIAMKALHILHPTLQDNPDKRPLSGEQARKFRRLFGSQQKYEKAFLLLAEIYPEKTKRQQKLILRAATLLGLNFKPAFNSYVKFLQSIKQSR